MEKSNRNKVETISSLAMWRVGDLDSMKKSSTSDQWSFWFSDPFTIGIWEWVLAISKVEDNPHLNLGLLITESSAPKRKFPIAKYVFRVFDNAKNSRSPCISPIHETLYPSRALVWKTNLTLQSTFIVDVEILELSYPGGGGDETTCSISSDVEMMMMMQSLATQFESMFKEKETSLVNIDDMSQDSCTALLCYIYGTTEQDVFLKQRLSLLAAADKYGMTKLKEYCEESLLKDIRSSNVLERLQNAWFYQLNQLKKSCYLYLFYFGKFYDLKDEIDSFFCNADQELMSEMFQEMMKVWKHV